MKCILTQQSRGSGSGGSSFELIKLEITTPPTKTSYLSGTSFDKTGMVVMGTYGIDGIPMNTVDVTANVSVTPDVITDGISSIKLSMRTNSGKEISVMQPIEVIPRLVELQAEGPEQDWVYGEYMMLVKWPAVAIYSDSSFKSVKANIETAIGMDGLPLGQNSIELSYTENDITVMTVVKVNVVPKEVPKPVWKQNLVYHGALIKVNSEQYWANYNMVYFSLVEGYTGANAGIYTAIFTLNYGYAWEDGSPQSIKVKWGIDRAVVTTIPEQIGSLVYNGSPQTPELGNYNIDQFSIELVPKTNAGTYTAAVSPTDNYRWEDGTIDPVPINWTIQKANRTLTLNPSSIEFSKGDSAKEIKLIFPSDPLSSIFDRQTNINYNISGVVEVLEVSPGEDEAYWSVRVIYDGVTNIADGKISIYINETPNYLQSNTAVLTVNADTWEFGEGEGEEADEAWFMGLKKYLVNNSGKSIVVNGGSCVGCTKTITLTSPVLGTTTHLIRVIGLDKDGMNTLTFQTANCLKESTRYSDTLEPIWKTSFARMRCDDYYNAFPGKNAIKTVNKGTCEVFNDSRNGTPTYADEKVFILSERELGLDANSPLSVANSTTTKAECTYGYNASYNSFTNNASRAKRYGDTGAGANYWTRSRYYDSDQQSMVCCIFSTGVNEVNNFGVKIGLAPAFVIGNEGE